MGNQLFQYAFARNLAETNHAELALDTFEGIERHYPRCIYKYELGNFNITAKIATRDELDWAMNVRIWQRLGLAKKWTHIKEKEFNIFQDDVFTKYDKNLYIGWGSWENENYFKSVSDILRKEFTVKRKYESLLLNRIANSDSVAIHVRKGNDTKLPVYTDRMVDLASSGYYNSAIETIKQKISNPVFFIFSLDIDWCKKNLVPNGSEIYFVENSEDPILDFYMMKMCRHQVIANSTYSWWAAWLNENPDKIIICPKKWFLNQSKDDHYSLHGWTKI